MSNRILPASDPVWNDPEYRTARLRGLMELYNLRAKDVAQITDVSLSRVKHWSSGKYWPISKCELRCLMYDLMSLHDDK